MIQLVASRRRTSAPVIGPNVQSWIRGDLLRNGNAVV